MKSKPRIILIFAIMTACSISALHAQQALPKLPSAVEIDSIWITGAAEKGGAFEVNIRYTANVAGLGEVEFRVPEHISIPERGFDIKNIRENKSFYEGEMITEKLVLRAVEKGTGIFFINISLPKAPRGFHKRVFRWFR